MRARALLLAALAALACARPCSPSEFADAMDVAAARRVLGVEGVASAEQTRAAFHRASLRAHPDKPGGSHEAFVKVTEAYDVLRNGAASPARSGFTSGASWRAGAESHARGGDAPAGSSGHASESRAFAWRFSSSPLDADAEASAERSARTRERAFEAFQRARRAWSPGDARDARDAGEARGGNGRRAWWDGGRRPAGGDAGASGARPEVRAPRAPPRDDRWAFGRGGDDDRYDSYDFAVPPTNEATRGGEPSAGKWWDTKVDFGRDAKGGSGASRAGRCGARDELESMEEYVWRRAWADARGVTGHDRGLHDGASAWDENDSPFLETASPYGDDAGWDDARRRASRGEDAS